MTNYEAYKEEIIMTLVNDESLAVKNGKPGYCGEIPCGSCDLKPERMYVCMKSRRDWLNAEYIEKPVLTQRERHLCKAIETGWIARDKDNRLFAYTKKPKKGVSMWIDGNDVVTICGFMPNSFEFIQWKDHEPWSIEELLKLEVEE